MGTRIHPTAQIESGVAVGDGSAVWDSVHVRRGASIGGDCIIGEKTYIAPDVRIADRVKINAFVYICTGVTIERGVMIAAGTIFTNDRFPRATTPDLSALRGSEPDEHTLETRVAEGATIGAGCVIGCGIEIGRFAMVGMGAVVTRSVPPFHLAIGQPAVSVGYVCRCGTPFHRGGRCPAPEIDHAVCRACGLAYAVAGGVVTELTPPAHADRQAPAAVPTVRVQ